MSMIYECPNCHTPQAAGRTACRHCGAEFDSAVPEDAFLPDGTPAEPAPLDREEAVVGEPAASEAEAAGAIVYETPAEAAVETGPVAVETVAVEPVAQKAPADEAEPPPPPVDAPVDTEAPPPEVVLAPPAPAETLPYQSSPYSAPASQSAPTHAQQDEETGRQAPASAPAPLSRALTRGLLIAAPIVLVFVLGAVFFACSLDSGPDTAPTPVPAPIPTPADASTASGTLAAPPYILNGAGASTGADADPHAQRLVGRWESKKLDFYVFNENKTGTRGSATGGGPSGTFLWTLARNRLILYADKQEKLTYTQGPDGDTMFLRAQGGKYVQYTRAKG